MVILNEHAVSLYLSAKIRRNFFGKYVAKSIDFAKKNVGFFLVQFT